MTEAASIIIDLETDKLVNNVDLNAVGKLMIYDENGNRHAMEDLWKDYKTIFIFVRSFLCFTSKEYVEDLAFIDRNKMKEKQIRICVIGCANWKHILNFKKLTRFPFLMFCDVDGEVYKKLGMNKCKDLGSAGDSIHVKSSTFTGLIKSSYRAFKSQFYDFQGDFAQQGGSLIVGPGNVLSFIHVDKHGRDHAPINTLLESVGVDKVNFDRSIRNF